MKMNHADRTEWLNDKAAEIGDLFFNKYEAGRKEHKSDLGEVPTERLVDEMINEALDQLAYALEIKRRLGLIKESDVKKAVDAISKGKWI